MYSQMFYHTHSPTAGQAHHLEPPHVSNVAAQNADPVLINRRIYCSSGQFAGQIIRYELEELQKASLGRKYARVDRRPLDPPPVVLVKIWKYCSDTGNEEEFDYDDVLTHGLLCTVDLFRVPVTAKAPKDSPTCTTSSPRSQKATQTSDGFVHFNPPGLPLAESLAPSPLYRPHSYGPSDIVHYYDGHPLLESSKNTPYLVGATFVQPVLVELSGQKCIVFVFSDLAVKSEGTFTLRYRIFDLFSPTPDPRGSQSPPSSTYRGSPSSQSSASTPSDSIPSPQLSTAATVATAHSATSPPIQFVSDPRPLHTHLHAQPHSHLYPQASQPPITNPYPDPYQDYSAPPPRPHQARRRLTDPGDAHQDFQAQFAPHDSHPRVEPEDQSTSFSILGECWAKGSFRIYSTKEFPGLPASTGLTKLLARWGVRLNIRETERKRRRRSAIDDEDDYSDAGVGDSSSEVTREQVISPHKTMATKSKPQVRAGISPQIKSLSLRSSPQKLAASSTSPGQGQQWTGQEGHNCEESGETLNGNGHIVASPFDDDRLIRTPQLTGAESYPYSHPHHSMSGFNPSHARVQLYAAQETQSQCGHSVPPQTCNVYANSNGRSTNSGQNGFSSHSASNETLFRYARERKRDSGSSSSSGCSIRDPELHDMGYSFSIDVSRGTNG